MFILLLDSIPCCLFFWLPSRAIGISVGFTLMHCSLIQLIQSITDTTLLLSILPGKILESVDVKSYLSDGEESRYPIDSHPVIAALMVFEDASWVFSGDDFYEHSVSISLRMRARSRSFDSFLYWSLSMRNLTASSRVLCQLWYHEIRASICCLVFHQKLAVNHTLWLVHLSISNSSISTEVVLVRYIFILHHGVRFRIFRRIHDCISGQMVIREDKFLA